ncbi:MAG: flagellar basal body-associated FliL family protein [Candidatus Brocadia sp.]|nr:flagellar basal body-associated FliL family protein [Candidatus Brocadia sp.]
MTANIEKNEITNSQKNKTVDHPTSKSKGNKTIILMGGVVLISVVCAFVFVSKVYPALTGSPQLNAVEQEPEHAEETAVVQIMEPAEIEKEPVSSSKKKDEKGKEEKNEVAEESMIVPVDPVIVNLSDSNGRRYLKARINLEARDGDVKKKIESKSVQIKDRLISILSSKTLEDIEGLEGQENLRKEIKDTVDVVLKEGEGVVQVYFTEFVIQ